MNKRMPLLSVAVLAIGILTFTPGCSTVTHTAPDGSTSTSREPNVVEMQLAAKSAVFLGTTIWLRGLGPDVPGHPQDREAFELARTSVKALIAGGTFNAADLSAALQSLPVTELQGDSGTLLIGEALVLWDSYGRRLADLDKAKVFDTYILPVARSIAEGFDLALGPTPQP